MIAKFKRVNVILGWLSVLIGTLVLIGWRHEFGFLQHFFPQLYPMKSAAALCFILCGLSIASVGQNILLVKLLLRVGLIGVFLVGVVNIGNYFLYPFDLNNLDISVKMSLASGLLFCILSVVLLNNSISYRYTYKVNLFLILFGLAISGLAITGYMLDSQALYSLLPFSTMAPHTAVTFILLFVGAFIGIQDNELLNLISANSLWGNSARLLLPVGFLLPVALGFLLLLTVRLHFFTLEVSFILLVFLCSLIITAIVYQKSKVIHVIDMQKQKMLDNTQLMNRQLGRLNEEMKRHEYELSASNENLLAEKEALETTNETLDTFVHAASHDLRSPVQNMKAIHQLIHGEEDERMKEKYLKALESSTHRLETTIDGLMGIVALQSNQQANIEKISFKNVLKSVLEDCNLQKGDEINANFENAPDIVYVKPYLLSIIRNLVTNAIKYRSLQRRLQVEINTKRINNKVIFTIEDNGIGIDLKKNGHLLFQPFKRFSDQSVGSGIGLHLIKNMIEKNGGSIRVESTPGSSTIFYCELLEY